MCFILYNLLINVDVYRVGEEEARYLSGHQEMVAGIRITATAMATPIQYGLYRSAVQQKMALSLGTQKHVHQHLQQHTAVAHQEKNK